MNLGEVGDNVLVGIYCDGFGIFAAAGIASPVIEAPALG